MLLSYVVPITFQIIHIGIIVFAFIALLKRKNDALLNIILCGFGLLFIIIETQPRYSYIVCWIFILLACQGIEGILDFINKVKLDGWKFKKSFK